VTTDGNVTTAKTAISDATCDRMERLRYWMGL
jgi:hypothetical protein